MKSMLFSMVLALVLFVFQTASVRAGGQTCNGYNYIVLESGVGSNPWRGHIDLKTMQWEAKHHGGRLCKGSGQMGSLLWGQTRPPNVRRTSARNI
jgi:hypothetical protein